MTLQLLHSEFPDTEGKFDFLFYQCRGWVGMEMEISLNTSLPRNSLWVGWGMGGEGKVHSRIQVWVLFEKRLYMWVRV
jgi:hypothetical protein